MSLQRVQLAARQFRAPSANTLAALSNALSSFRISSPSTVPEAGGRRNASHQAQGRANGARDGPGKRLGAKKSGGQYVVPGNILFRQRGTHWFPGDGCYMGRDHTIHAQVAGYVTYYRDPDKHPKRKYIGVVFERHNTLPQAPNAPRRRRLGMLAYEMPETVVEQETGDLATPPGAAPMGARRATTFTREVSQENRQTIVVRSLRPDGRKGEILEKKLTLRPGYQWRQSNWEIGRAAERSLAAQAVRPYVPGNRWLAWRKRTKRIARAIERRNMVKGGKKKKQKQKN